MRYIGGRVRPAPFRRTGRGASLLVPCSFLLCLASCGPDDMEKKALPSPEEAGLTVSDVTCYSATISGQFNVTDTAATPGIRYGLRNTKSLAQIGRLATATPGPDGTLTAHIEGLAADTTYYFMTVGNVPGYQSVTSSIYSFRTRRLTAATNEATNVFAFGAQLGLTLSEEVPPGKFKGSYGVYVTNKSRISDLDPTLLRADSLYRIRGLKPGQTYHYAAYVRQRTDDNRETLIVGQLRDLVLPPITVLTDTALPTSTYYATLSGNANVEFKDIPDMGFILFARKEEPTIETALANPKAYTIIAADHFDALGWGDFGKRYELLEAKHNYYYRAYARIKGGHFNGGEEIYDYYYGRVVQIKTERLVLSEGEGIDLGLSVRWSSRNVGATTPQQVGTTARWDDRERLNMPGGWRLPTQSEVQELVDSCHWVWFTFKNPDMDGTDASGALITGPSGNTIFLPANEHTGGKPTYANYMCESDTVIEMPLDRRNVMALTFGLPDLAEQQADQRVQEVPSDCKVAVRGVQ